MQKIALILERQDTINIKASDIDIIGVNSDIEAKERLAEIVNNKEFGFVIINKALIGGLSMDLKKMLEESKKPLFIPIDIVRDDNLDNLSDLKEREKLSQMVYRAIGVQLMGGESIKD